MVFRTLCQYPACVILPMFDIRLAKEGRDAEALAVICALEDKEYTERFITSCLPFRLPGRHLSSEVRLPGKFFVEL